MRKTKIQKLLEGLREERTRKFGMEALIVSLDGMPSSGKDTQISFARHELPKDIPNLKIGVIRESGLLDEERNSERRLYMAQVYETVVRKNGQEDLDTTLKLMTAQRAEVGKKLIEMYNGQEILLLENRSFFSTWAIQLIARGLRPKEANAYEILEQILEPETVIPPHLAIFTICHIPIAMDRARRDYDESKYRNGKKDPDYFDPYYEVAYKTVHGKGTDDDETRRKWWLKVNWHAYKDIAETSGGKKVLTGRNDGKFNHKIEELIKKAHEKIMK